MADDQICKHCGGRRAARNPTGACDHLYWPDNLTAEAKLRNGYIPVSSIIWLDLTDDSQTKEARNDR